MVSNECVTPVTANTDAESHSHSASGVAYHPTTEEGAYLDTADPVSWNTLAAIPFEPLLIDDHGSNAQGSLPAWIRPLPSTFDLDDVDYLYRKGALHVFRKQGLTKLLVCFAEYVYPFMPVVDLQHLLEPLSNPRSSGQISLMLLHAITYAAAAFVEEGVLRDEGYGSRREARRLLFGKTKVLYQLLLNSTTGLG